MFAGSITSNVQSQNLPAVSDRAAIYSCAMLQTVQLCGGGDCCLFLKMLTCELRLTLTTLNYLCINHEHQRIFFQFEIIINVLVSSFCFIWIPVLWVYGHYKYLNSFREGKGLYISESDVYRMAGFRAERFNLCQIVRTLSYYLISGEILPDSMGGYVTFFYSCCKIWFHFFG